MSYVHISEEELVERVLTGDSASQKILYGRYVPWLMATALRYVVARQGAEDVLQESFIIIFESLEHFRYRGEGSLKAWMTKIVVTQSLKYMKSSHRLVFSEDADIPDVPDEAPTGGIPVEVLNEMIMSLPDGYRTVFNLHVVENRSHKEIAQMLGIKENSSASQFHHAKKLLMNKINNYLKQNE